MRFLIEPENPRGRGSCILFTPQIYIQSPPCPLFKRLTIWYGGF